MHLRNILAKLSGMRLLGIFMMAAFLYLLVLSTNETARSLGNQENIAARLGFYGILTLGVGLLIVAGGIDLSIGSVVGLGAVTFGLLLSGDMSHRTAFLLSGLAPLGLVLVGGSTLQRLLRDYALPTWLTLIVSLVLVLGIYALAWVLGYMVLIGRHLSPWWCTVLVLWVSGQIGLVHGFLVTRLRLQPFLVTLCGLFIYRGLARWASSTAVGIGVDTAEEYRAGVLAFREWLVGSKMSFPVPGMGTFSVPQQLVLLLILTMVLGLFLHGTRYGRYLFAIGANEDAARYAGIQTDSYKMLAYVICGLFAGLGGILTILESRSVTATNAGSLLELYAITGAVLGGCSLRGGEGSVLGMFLGAAILPLLRNLCSFGGISNELEYAVIGSALLIGTISDELLKRQTTKAN